MTVKVGKTVINLTEDFRQMQSAPDDPQDSVVFGYMLDESNALLFLMPCDVTMPVDDTQSVIDGIHSSLGENQGLIEVKNGKTVKGAEYIYSIVKTIDDEMGAQYCLTLDLTGDKAVTIQGFFSEVGTTGKRDGVIMVQLLNEGILDESLRGWMSDPYDKSYDNGIPMNMSENEKYDRDFPQHPLTKVREFIKFFVMMN